MAYITKADILTRVDERKLIQLTDDAGAGTVNDEVVNAIVLDAEGTFESYARTRYTLPVPKTQKVKSVCLDIAVFKLYERRASIKDGIFDVREKAHDKAIKFLEAISKGQAALDVPASEETKTSPASADTVLKGSSRPVFTDERLKGF
jgi:phage gp36-like protein